MAKDPKDEVKDNENQNPEVRGTPRDPIDALDGQMAEERAIGVAPDSLQGAPTVSDVVATEVAKLREELTNTYAEENKLLRERIRQLEEEKTEGINLEVGKIREEMETLRSKLPKTVRDNPAKIQGYYDFDSAANKYMNDATNRDKAKAVEQFRLLGA